MSRGQNPTGPTANIRTWLQRHPDRLTTAAEIAQELALANKVVSNSLYQLFAGGKSNIYAGPRRGTYFYSENQTETEPPMSNGRQPQSLGSLKAKLLASRDDTLLLQINDTFYIARKVSIDRLIDEEG